MLREGPIPAVVQGVIEYLLGIFLIAAPFLFDYDDSSAALGMSIALGVLLLVVAAISEGKTGLVKQLPVSAHVAVDFVLAIFFIAAPFILGFGDEATPRNLFIAVGVVFLLVTIGTRYREPAAERSGGGTAGGRSATSGGSPTRGTATPQPRPSGTAPTSTGGSAAGTASAAGGTTPPPARPLDPPTGSSGSGSGSSPRPPTP